MNADKQKTILGIGGAHIDRRGRIAVDFVPGASNPGTMREDVGGGACNALRNAVQRGVGGWMLSVRGGDMAGETVAKAIAAAGIRDLSVTFLDRATPSYTALLDRHGDVVAALADMGLYELAIGKQLRRASVRAAVAEADAIFTDANLSAEALARIPKLAGEKPIFAIAISPAKVLRLKTILPALSCLFLNTREAGALTGLSPDAPMPAMLDALKTLGLRRAVLSKGADPLLALDGDRRFSLAPPAPERIADVTGAGDALAGATSAALLRGVPLAEAVREGMAAALLALESADAVPALSTAAFAAALALVPPVETLHEAPSKGEAHVA
ncbi:carbohydrate kinase family protein [Mesorhizobium sp. LHD-90]|uniref:carbohydrate kinase family protein n=1 Tax=Mesorhizobium sp. LHD-90 TaxID=3071414 RepID=UPI0027E10F80|nr:carbohydrate kinase family protein [Mesorhizobium sp. LHD-90]MDQ6437185.1 carbohydrate kinase family protein [Mesorhizobium sp. LHD-90]